MTFFFDLDGCVIDGTERFKLAGPEPSRAKRATYKKWVKKVNKNLDLDSIVPGMQQIIKALIASNQEVFYLTSREERCRSITESWLIDNGLPIYNDEGNSMLIMRPNDNWADAADYKEIAIKALTNPGEMAVVYDDDEHGTIEAMAKRNGFTFLKARSGGQR